VDGGALLAGEFADSGALIVEFDQESYVAAKDAACGGVVEPGTLCLCSADGGREQRQR